MNRDFVSHIANFSLFVTLQVLIFRNLVLFDISFVFVYLTFLLLLPVELPKTWAMILGFVTGLVVDIFSNTMGIQAFSSVLLMFLRPNWLNFVTPRSGYESGDLPMIRSFGIPWFVWYAFPLVLLHHLTVFFIEAGGTQLFGQTLLKSLASSVFSLVFIICMQYLFYSNTKK